MNLRASYTNNIIQIIHALTVGSHVCSKVSSPGSSSWWWAVVDTRRIANTPRAMKTRWRASESGQISAAGTPHTPPGDGTPSLEGKCIILITLTASEILK